MPNLLAHCLLAKRLYNSVDKEGSFLKDNYLYLSAGCQGPDPLFFLGLIPKNGLHLFLAKKKIGNKIHKSDATRFFKLLFDELYSIDNVLEKNRFEAFIFGQISHYFLDKIAHPYVMYESGFDGDGKITGSYHYKHTFFETNIDMCLADRFSLVRFFKAPYEQLVSDERTLRGIDSHFIPVLARFIEKDRLPKNLYSSSVKNMIFFYKFMNKNGKRKSKMIGKKISLSGIYIPEKKDISVINESRKRWLEPDTGTSHNESFYELLDQSYNLLSSCYRDFINKGFNYQSLKPYLDQRDYYGTLKDKKRIYKKENERGE